MDKIILTYPNAVLYYHAPGKPLSGPSLFKEVEKGEYGYRLTVGQKLEGIRYHGTNYDYFVQPTVLEIKKDGLVIEHWKSARKGVVQAFVSFKKLLPNGGGYEIRDMYIEPCGELYEKNNLVDVLAGTIAEESYFANGKWDEERGKGIWYQHGGRRTSGRDDNLQNFIKMGQQSLFEG